MESHAVHHRGVGQARVKFWPDDAAQRAFKADRISRSCALDMLSAALWQDANKPGRLQKPICGEHMRFRVTSLHQVIDILKLNPNLFDWDRGV